MNDETEPTEAVQMMDLGDATLETRNVSPLPPYYTDSLYGFGVRPT